RRSAREEACGAGRFRFGAAILLAVPESGRFSFVFARLTVVGPRPANSPDTAPRSARIPDTMISTDTDSAPPDSTAPTDSTAESGPLPERLAAVWADFEAELARVPVLARLAEGTVTVDDYRRLLFNLRQQVVEGARWISRAASNFDADHFELRSAAIGHAEEEHRDFLLIERNYVASGGTLAEIRSGRKNVGSEALSGYMFHQASL